MRLFCLVAFLLAQTAWAQDVPIVIKASRLFDAGSGNIISPGFVTVQGDRIIAVGADGTDGAEVIELGDATLLPGLIDAHTHLTYWQAEQWGDLALASDAELALRGAGAARRTLEAGFTTVRDLWAKRRADVTLRDAINRGDVPGPRIVASAIALGARGGHCEQTFWELETTPGLDGGVAAGSDGFRDAVRHAIRAGADVIKLCVTSGIASAATRPDLTELTIDEVAAAVDEAHRHGLKVAVHAHSDAGALMAINAGADSIEHGSLMSRETLELLRQRDAFLVADIAGAEYANGAFGEVVGMSDAELRKSEQVYAPFISMVEMAIDMEVKFAFGTDAGVIPHGRNAKQFSMLVERGMSPAQALQSATVVAADLLGLGDEIGQINPGYRADIIAVQGNPLADISTTESVVFVMKDGKIYKQR